MTGPTGAPLRDISDEALAQMAEKQRVQEGWRRLTWHDFRRTFAGILLDNGNDLVMVHKLMGYASPAKTAGCDRRGEEVNRRSVQAEPDDLVEVRFFTLGQTGVHIGAGQIKSLHATWNRDEVREGSVSTHSRA